MSDAGNETDGVPTTLERRVLEAIRTLRYGTVEITVHDAEIVQVERREKVRYVDGSPVQPAGNGVKHRPPDIRRRSRHRYD